MNQIAAIIFCQFDPVAGPKISCQVPTDYISSKGFDSIHNYIITKPELQGRLITVTALDHIILGCPVVIDNPKYARNALIFNLCFVFDKAMDTSNYEPVVKKLAAYLTQLEMENGLLSDDDSKERLPSFLSELLTSLNKDGTCSIPMGESCTVHLKVPPIIQDPPNIQDHDVPIIIKDKNSLNLASLDLTTQQVLMYINGFNHVSKIAAEADVERNLVKVCLQNLLHYKIIKIISIFQYSNMYTVTPQIPKLVEDRLLQEECVRFVARKAGDFPNFRDVFLLYSGLTVGTTVKDICCRYNPHAMKIDEKKLIQFGLIKGFIRRLHKFPVYMPSEAEPVVTSSKLQGLYSLCTGLHSYDEICTKLGITYQVLDEKIDNDPNVVPCWK
ncbi:GATOR complex protein NPRL2-like [Ylistrum balloti]|uniref:GATOR complex protein NPRL2-like n=1 Tax=Ylistrum balloti TaxID=509963 RepID=UPI002905B0FA|nr:GATOR complex protein NPRL2-like [Ylistrum balloti]